MLTMSDGNCDSSVYFSLRLLPPAINGIALGNAALAVLWRRISDTYDINVVFPTHFFASISIIFISLYILKACFSFQEWTTNDLKKPLPASTLGAMAIALSLLASLLSEKALHLNHSASLIGISIAAIIQFLSAMNFMHVCYKTETLPEPFYNTAIHSVTITAITGVGVIPAYIKFMCLALGMLGMVVTQPYITWRLFFSRNELLANNQTIAMYQAAPSIVCVGWHMSPLTGTVSTGLGHAISHILFALVASTVVLNLVAIYDRRAALLQSLFLADPVWAAFTFPFAITSNAVILYGAAHWPKSKLVLVIVSILLVMVGGLVTWVNFLYLRNAFFCLRSRDNVVIVPDIGQDHADPSAHYEDFFENPPYSYSNHFVMPGDEDKIEDGLGYEEVAGVISRKARSFQDLHMLPVTVDISI